MTKKLGLIIGLTLGSVALVSAGTVATVFSLSQKRDNVNNLKISSNTGIINISQADIDSITSATTPIKNKVMSLLKLFKGVNESNIKNIEITKPSNTEIALNANGNFFFNSENIKSIKANFKIVDILNITPKRGIINISQKDIDDMLATTTSDTDKILILSILFDGVNSRNLNSFRIQKTSDTAITLLAKEGFAFGSSGSSSIKANIKIRKILEIKPKGGTININQEDVNIMISSTASTKDRATALSKLFDGVTELNVVNVRAVRASVTTIALNTLNGFTFGSGNITSIRAVIKVVSFLDIKPKPGIINITQADIDAMISTSNAPKDRIAALSKLFDGVNERNVVNVKAVKTSDTVITLNALNSYTFNQNATSIKVNINIVVRLNISPKKTIGNITEADIQAMMSPTNTGKERAAALSKIFDGVTEGNVASFTVQRPTTKEILLKAIKGYAFGESLVETTKASIETIVEILNITAKTGAINVSQADVDKMISVTSSIADKITALSKLFNGIDDKNINNITIEKKTGVNIIVLKPKPGFLINNTTSLESVTYTFQKINLTITIKQNPKNFNLQEVDDLEKQNTPQQLNALKKLFEGTDLNPENQAHFTVAVNKSTKIVTLTAKDGYLINNNPSLNSMPYAIGKINLIIASKQTAGGLNIWEAEDLEKQNTPQQLNALKKLFDGIDLTTENQANFTIKIDKATRIVTLTAKENYTINNQASLNSLPYKDIKINLGINNRDHSVTFDRKWDVALKTPSPTITADQVAALGYLFQFVTTSNAKNFTYIVTQDNIVTITAKPGYTFVDQKTGQELPSLTCLPYKTR
ncbi:MAG: hypothetical protein ACRDAW_00850 [Metamycoplasmataceae bacterium]